jgi:hypothetical protein
MSVDEEKQEGDVLLRRCLVSMLPQEAGKQADKQCGKNGVDSERY